MDGSLMTKALSGTPVFTAPTAIPSSLLFISFSVKHGLMAGLAMLRALDGEAVWPPPIWLMRQAGRYLPEYRALRASAADFLTLVTTPELAAEVTLQPLRRFGFDAAILFSDLPIVPWALGHGLEYREGEGPVLPKLRDAAGVAALDPARLTGAIAPVLETVRRVRAGIAAEGHDAALIGFAGGPFTVACYMVEGGGSKDFAATRRMAYAEPALFAALMERLTEATIAYLSAQAEAGADVSDAIRFLGRHPVPVAVRPPRDRTRRGASSRALKGRGRPDHRLSPSGGRDARSPMPPRRVWMRSAWTPRPIRVGRAARWHGASRYKAILIRWPCWPAGRRCGPRHRPSWRRCAGGRSCSTWATASCRETPLEHVAALVECVRAG